MSAKNPKEYFKKYREKNKDRIKEIQARYIVRKALKLLKEQANKDKDGVKDE